MSNDDEEKKNGCLEQYNRVTSFAFLSYIILFILSYYRLTKIHSYLPSKKRRKFVIFNIVSLLLHCSVPIFVRELVHNDIIDGKALGNNKYNEMGECKLEEIVNSMVFLFIIFSVIIALTRKSFFPDVKAVQSEEVLPERQLNNLEPNLITSLKDTQNKLEQVIQQIERKGSTEQTFLGYRGTASEASTSIDPLVQRNLQVMADFQSVLSS